MSWLALHLAPFIFAFGILRPYPAEAVPSISLQTSLDDSSRILALSITPLEQLESCAYRLYGSGERSAVRARPLRARVIAELPASNDVVSREALTKRLRGTPGGRSSVYLRAVALCEGQRLRSNVVRLRIRERQRGVRSSSQWLKDAGKKIEGTNIQLVRVFPALSFSQPVALVSAPGTPGRFYVVEQGGKMFSFPNDATTTEKLEVLDISGRIRSGGELGLLGLAFHPNFAQNRYLYVNYTEPRSQGSSQSRTVISRFTLGQDGRVDTGTELRLLEVNQPFSNHNGGDLAFGPDGYLYIALGDGGSGGDPQGNAQNRSVLLGKILRIDVDQQVGVLNYAIPSSNPYSGNTAGYREEIFAYGLRNPFRFAFDTTTGKLWAGDVGQNAVEEIDVIEAGGNYGWNRMEGTSCYPPNSNCDRTGLTLPVTDYRQTLGKSVIGGRVYRGSALPTLRGWYLFGDFVSGRIFAHLPGSGNKNQTLLESGLLISSFGHDQTNELYVVSYGDGALYQIK